MTIPLIPFVRWPEMTRPLIAVPALALFVLALGCAAPTTKEKDKHAKAPPEPPKTKTEKAIEYADNLKQAVEQFEESRNKTSVGITETTKSTNDALAQEKPQLQGLAKDWEVRWDKVKAEVANMEASLKLVGQRSLAYFDQLKEISAAITDPELRKPEQEKNKELEQRWTKIYQAAIKDVQRLRAVLDKGDNFHRVLLGAALRQSLEKDIQAISDIANQANQVLKELGTLTEEGRKLAVAAN